MRRISLFLALALLATLALADTPETGIIEGTVSDAEGTALPGVQVTLQGERGSQISVSDANGTYRFTLLPPGPYSVTASLEGFSEATGTVNVNAGGKTDMPLEMRLETAETITVTSEAPMVDKFNVTAGSTVTAEVGQEAAGENRTYYGVINMLPGVTSDSENGDIQGTRPQVNGSHFADNAVFIDGVDTTFGRFGGGRVLLPTSATAEVSLVAGGASAEYGRKIGSTTNVIIKSGTNKFHGEVTGTKQETKWASDYDSHIELTQRQVDPVPADYLKRLPFEEDTGTDSFEASLGGPIIRDKAWFFVGASDLSTDDRDKTLNFDEVDVSLDTNAEIYKFNFQPAQSHQLAVSYIDSFAARIYFHPPSGDEYTPTPHRVPGELFSGSWNWSISNSLFLETKLADQTSDENKFLAVPGQDIGLINGASNPIEDVYAGAVAIKQNDPRFPAISDPTGPHAGRYYPGNNYDVYITGLDNEWHNGWLLDNGFGVNEYPRDQANAALTWFANESHELKFGLDWQEVHWDSNVRTANLLFAATDFDVLSPSGFDPTYCGVINGNVCLLQDFNTPELRAQGNLSTSENTDISLYVRDRFTIGDHWTFNAGVRIEDVDNKNDVGRSVVDTINVAPRLSLNYDFAGDGRKLITFNAGRYYAQLNQQFTTQWLQEEWNGYIGRDEFIWCDAFDVFVHTVAAPGALTDPFGGGCSSMGYNFQIRHVTPGRMWELNDAGFFNSDIEPYYKDEFILGYEWQFTQNWALDVKAISWEMDNLIGNTQQRDNNGNFFTLSANYSDIPDIMRSIGFIDNFVALNADNDLFNGNAAAAAAAADDILNNFEEGRTEYDALQIQLNKRFSNGWAWFNNLTWADSETTGAGAWWNNTNSTYAWDLTTVLTQTYIDGVCSAEVQDARTVPLDLGTCRSELGSHLGEPVSTINRWGKMGIASGGSNEGGALADRPFIFKSFGFKQFTWGKKYMNVGGSFTYQDGISWGRVEEVEPADGADPSDIAAIAFTGGLDIQVEPVGRRRLSGHYWLNLSTAFGFPIGNRVSGEVRLEGTNITDQQHQTNISDKGEVFRVRRDFQRPRAFRVLGTLRF